VIKANVASSKLEAAWAGRQQRRSARQGTVAIGSPFGYEESITAGIVSAVDRDIEAPNGYSIRTPSRPTRQSTTVTPADR
jgi:putative serine protease PepD